MAGARAAALVEEAEERREREAAREAELREEAGGHQEEEHARLEGRLLDAERRADRLCEEHQLQVCVCVCVCVCVYTHINIYK